jgi:mycofactocin precursor
VENDSQLTRCIEPVDHSDRKVEQAEDLTFTEICIEEVAIDGICGVY